MIEPREKIAAQARAALIAGVIGLVCLGFVFGTGAIIRAHVTRGWIEQHGVGDEQLPRVKLATILGVVGAAGWSLAAVIWVV